MERLVPDGLQIIMKGIGQHGDILRQGDVFGIDMIISSEELRDTRPITCISYVEVAALSREDLEEVRSNFPTVSGILHKAAMVLALGNAMPHAASKAARACLPSWRSARQGPAGMGGRPRVHSQRLQGAVGGAA